MPNCDKFFKELGECLIESDCVLKDKNKPTECLNLLMKTKAYNNAKMGMDLGYDNRNTLDLINPKSTPTECMLKHQAYVECKISLMNPRKRFRAPYGGVIDPDLLDKETNKL